MERFSRGVISTLNVAAGALFALAIAINFANVVGRYAFHSPFYWAEEVTTLLIIWAVCLMSFRLTAHSEHLATDILRPFLPARLQRALLILLAVMCLAAASYVAYYAYVVVSLVARLSQVTTVAEIPKSIANGSILACFGLAVMGGLVRLLRLIDTTRALPGPVELDTEALALEVSR